MRHIIISLSVLFLIGIHSTAYSQPKPATDKTNLINGKLWTPVFTNANGSQFFLNERKITGNLLFDGVWHNKVEFMYDIANDLVITTIKTPQNETKNIILNKNRLSSFTFSSNKQDYLFMKGNKINNKLKPNSYYQIFTTPNLRYAIRRFKVLKVSRRGFREFDYKTEAELFIIKKEEVIRIKNKRQLLQALLDKKKELKKYIRNNKIKISLKQPLNLIPVILYYNKLCD